MGTPCCVDDCPWTDKLRRGMCPTHYERMRRLGTTDLPSPTVRLHRGLARQPNGCLEWTGHTTGGYGQIRVEGKTVSTHRLAWELEHGPIPPGMCVLHHCDNPPCADAIDTEHHLFLGTKADNAADMVNKGRHAQQKKEATG